MSFSYSRPFLFPLSPAPPLDFPPTPYVPLFFFPFNSLLLRVPPLPPLLDFSHLLFLLFSLVLFHSVPFDSLIFCFYHLLLLTLHSLTFAFIFCGFSLFKLHPTPFPSLLLRFFHLLNIFPSLTIPFIFFSP